MISFEHTIGNQEGIHARPAGLLVRKAQGYRADLQIKKNDKSADLKRLFAVLGLCVKQGEQISVTASGEDEQVASAELREYMQKNL